MKSDVAARFCALLLLFFFAAPHRISHAAPLVAEEKNSSGSLSILSPSDGAEVTSGDVLVKLAVRMPPGSTLLGLRALIDGRLAVQLRGVSLTPPTEKTQVAAGQQLLTVPIPPHDCVLTVIAETTAEKLTPVSVHLRVRSAGSAAAQLSAFQPTLYVLAIGISEHQQPGLALRFAAKDAHDLASTLKLQSKILYRSVETRVLTNQQATKSSILDGLDWLQRQTTARDLAVLFLSGHGLTDPGTGNYYFLPHDADTSAVKRTLLPESELRDTLSSIPGKVLLFLDSRPTKELHASVGMRSLGALSSFVNELSSAENGVVVFAGSSGQQVSPESEEWNNGAFTKALIEGLRGRADYGKTRRITINMLDVYISERVKALTAGKQTPTTKKPATIPDFPIAIVRELRNEDVDILH